jgi:D-arabinose 1-dehydrogenase-like Zn-dependent alcohol dehydrogenase
MAYCIDEIFRLYSGGKLVQAPVSLYALHDVPKALADLRERRVSGRLILQPAGDAKS